jgi:lysine/ornithine N-monooxygenase
MNTYYATIQVGDTSVGTYVTGKPDERHATEYEQYLDWCDQQQQLDEFSAQAQDIERNK